MPRRTDAAAEQVADHRGVGAWKRPTTFEAGHAGLSPCTTARRPVQSKVASMFAIASPVAVEVSTAQRAPSPAAATSGICSRLTVTTLLRPHGERGPSTDLRKESGWLASPDGCFLFRSRSLPRSA